MKRMASVAIPRSWKKPRFLSSGSDLDSTNSESVCSVQQRDTDPARDTSDSEGPSEYEVAGLSPDQPNPFFSTDDSDEMHELNEIAELGAVAVTVGANLTDVDVGQLADWSVEPSSSPTSNSDVDPGLPRLDYLDFWTCAQCGANNENRHVPFCSACYTMRKSFFPPRPRRRRPLIDLPAVLRSTDSAGSVDVVDGPTPTNSQSSVKTEPDSGVESVDSPANMCQICCTKFADGLFSHGRTAHRYACYGCAKQTWRLKGPCPLCRRKIDRVLKLL